MSICKDVKRRRQNDVTQTLGDESKLSGTILQNEQSATPCRDRVFVSGESCKSYALSAFVIINTESMYLWIYGGDVTVGGGVQSLNAFPRVMLHWIHDRFSPSKYAFFFVFSLFTRSPASRTVPRHR